MAGTTYPIFSVPVMQLFRTIEAYAYLEAVGG